MRLVRSREKVRYNGGRAGVGVGIERGVGWGRIGGRGDVKRSPQHLPDIITSALTISCTSFVLFHDYCSTTRTSHHVCMCMYAFVYEYVSCSWTSCIVKNLTYSLFYIRICHCKVFAT